MISVVVPIYNCASYLDRGIHSLINQTIFNELEIIFINDGSDDNSELILQTYIDKYSNMKLICQKNKGVSAARNRGIEEARGEYIAFFDADDIAEEMLDIIIPDLPFESGDEVVVLLSGLGATPVMEQYIVYNRVEEILTEKGIKVHRSYVGNYFTSLEMMGVTLTVMKLDDELKECIDMPANSVGLKQF